jgi:hypothetical protein
MSGGNIKPLHAMPQYCFPGVKGDPGVLKAVRTMAKPIHGMFMVRNLNTEQTLGSFVMGNTSGYDGRWFLGRIRKHKTQPGRFEILIRRNKTCYYKTVDSEHDLADELRFMDVDADVEFSSASGGWITTPDAEFTEIGFSSGEPSRTNGWESLSQ